MSGHLQPGCEDELWLALQICDSSFPGGAFAHSLGLESALQHKFVNGGTGTLDLFVSLALEQACAQLIPLVSSAHESYFRISRIEKICPELSLKDLIRVDNLCHITLTNEVARRSSINQGKCFFRATKEAFISTSVELSALVDAVEQQINSNTAKLPVYERTQTIPGKEDSYVFKSGSNGTSGLDEINNINHKFQFHYAPTFGAVCGALNISLKLTQRMFLRCMLRDLFSSAARLNIMGPLEGARMQREYSPVVERLLSTKYDKEIMMLAGEKVHTVSTTPTVYVPQFNAVTDIAVDDKIKALMSTRIDASQPVTTSPILEILQARHDVLYARLFNS